MKENFYEKGKNLKSNVCYVTQGVLLLLLTGNQPFTKQE